LKWLRIFEPTLKAFARTSSRLFGNLRLRLCARSVRNCRRNRQHQSQTQNPSSNLNRWSLETSHPTNSRRGKSQPHLNSKRTVFSCP
ncbi:unnamed protein product, partial [Amoebophrya sp. A25]